MAELELEATHTQRTYAFIMSLSSLQLPMRPSSCKLKLEAELNSAQSDPPCCCSCRGGIDLLKVAGRSAHRGGTHYSAPAQS